MHNGYSEMKNKVIQGAKPQTVQVARQGAATPYHFVMYFKHNPVYYWAIEKGTAEVDFMLKQRQEVIQIEVKAEENLKAKSLKVYVEQFQPKQVIRRSMTDYREQNWLVNVPLHEVCSKD
mgnify:FL=1